MRQNFRKALASQMLENIGLLNGTKDLKRWPETISPLNWNGFQEKFGLNSYTDKEAFQIISEGQGSEKDKITSILSSSLLSVHTFHKLFKNEKPEEYYIEIQLPGESQVRKYSECLFEIRNEVINLPSCIDVILIEYNAYKEVDSILFLESKFTEYLEDINDRKEYGKSYIPLYRKEGLMESLKQGNISVDEKNQDNLILTSDSKLYIEGIKQSISHLIGLVKGPKIYEKEPKNQSYPQYYQTKYKNLFEQSKVLFYGSILFQTPTLQFSEYKEIYQKIIANKGETILKGIYEWSGKEIKPIKILSNILTYQDIFNTIHNSALLNDNVRKLYGL